MLRSSKSSSTDRPDTSPRRRVCFVTGTRAEFGLMRRTLAAIRAHRALDLQLIVTGMHLSRAHGRTIDEVRRDGFAVDATVPWSQGDGSPALVARATGRAIAGLADAFERFGTDVVLVVGDRVEAFAAASAAHLSQRCLAHVHGGDRAEGQVDDSLRHSITKLAHVHFAASKQSADRLARLGEDAWRIHRVGAPGVEGIVGDASPERVARKGDAVLLLHPVDADPSVEARRAALLIGATLRAGARRLLLIDPNNDPGHAGISGALARTAGREDVVRLGSPGRATFLSLLRDASLLVGNSSAGILEAASFGLPVVNVGPRQAGRERPPGVIDVAGYDGRAVEAAVRECIAADRRARTRSNPYARSGTASRISDVLATLPLGVRTLRKRIAY